MKSNMIGPFSKSYRVKSQQKDCPARVCLTVNDGVSLIRTLPKWWFSSTHPVSWPGAWNMSGSCQYVGGAFLRHLLSIEQSMTPCDDRDEPYLSPLFV